MTEITQFDRFIDAIFADLHQGPKLQVKKAAKPIV